MRTPHVLCKGLQVGAAKQAARLWPKELPQRIAAVRDLVSVTGAAKDWTATDVARAFSSAKRKDVEPVLDCLAALGLLVSFSAGESRRWRAGA